MTTTPKGVVMAVRDREVVVLTPDGAFRKMRLCGEPPQLGAEITLTETRVPSASRWGLAAVASIILVLVSSLVWRMALVPATAVAFVTLDINPSVELALDRSEQVIAANALNEDGRRLLQTLDLLGVPAEQAVAGVTTEAVRQGFLQPAGENTVLITWTPVAEGAKPQENLADRIKSSAGTVLQQSNLRGEVQTVQGSADMRQKASAVGLSVGKYAIWLESVESGLEMTPADLQANSVAKAIRAVGGNPGEIIGKAHAEKNYQELEKKVREKTQEQGRSQDKKDEKPNRDNHNDEDDRRDRESEDKSREKQDQKSEEGREDHGGAGKDAREQSEDLKDKMRDERNPQEQKNDQNVKTDGTKKKSREQDDKKEVPARQKERPEEDR